MNRQWLLLIEGASDQNLGQTLICLAKLAEAAHRFQMAQQMVGSCEVCLDYRDNPDRAEGFNSEPVIFHSCRRE